MANKKLLVIVMILALAGGFLGGFYFKNYQISQPVNRELVNRDLNQPAGVNFGDFWTVWNLLHEKFVDRSNLNTQDLVYGAIDGLVKTAGDPYTTFLRPKESENFAQEINGSFGGIGIEIGIREEILTVIAPIKGTPAERAGLLAGDTIVKIGDKSTENIKLQEAVSLIRGPKGTVVKITISRESSESKEVAIVRDTIKIPAAEWRLVDESVAHIQLFTFNKNADSEFKKVAKEITSSRADRIILDLRNNPGGLLDSAVNIAGYFLESDKIVTIEKFGDGRETVFRNPPNGQLKNYPLVILINKGSASASEILAGAIKDNRKTVIIGEKSFGKGSVQEITELPQKASVKISIAKWLTPSGVSINENGISPDIVIERNEDDIKNNRDPQLDKALEVIKTL